MLFRSGKFSPQKGKLPTAMSQSLELDKLIAGEQPTMGQPQKAETLSQPQLSSEMHWPTPKQVRKDGVMDHIKSGIKSGMDHIKSGIFGLGNLLGITKAQPSCKEIAKKIQLSRSDTEDRLCPDQ